MALDKYSDEELAAIANNGDLSQYSDAELEAIAGTGQSTPMPQNDATWAKNREEFLRNEGTLGTRIRNTPAKETAANVVKEPFRLAQEAVTAPANAAIKSLSGLAGIAAAPFVGVDKASQLIQSRPVLEGPMESSMMGEVLSYGVDKVNRALPNTVGGDIVRGGIEAGMDTAALLGAGKAVSKAAKVRQAYKNTPKNMEPDINFAIEYGVKKGIRPPVSGKRTDPQVRAYNQNAKTTVETIIDNKDALELTTAKGEVVRGKLPETNSQFAQAIDQAKRIVFKEYDGMKQAAGEAGAIVPLDGVAAELAPIIGNVALQDMKPGLVAYAKKMADTYTKRGAYTPEQAQSAIASYNASLEAFYKNPSYDAASKVAVDAAIVNTLRRSLDDTITNLEGPGYQQIKNKYGALKALEKDVNQRAVVSGRAAPNGFFDIANVATGAEAVSALLRLDPVGMAKAGTMQAIKARMKHMNKPDTAIKKMFERVDKLKNKQSPMGPPTPDPIPLPEVSTYFDKTIGARRPTQNQPNNRNPNNLPRGPITLSDFAIGTRIPASNPSATRTPINLQAPLSPNNSLPRTPLNLQQPEATYYDPFIGARTRRKQ